MSKLNISFNNTDYSIDESALSDAKAQLKSHLLSAMSGEGATINFDAIAYSVNSTKLANATNDFISHLGTIAGTGKKIKIGNVEYSVDSTKLLPTISDLEAAFDELASILPRPAAGLYKTGANYTELTTSWDDLVSSGAIGIDSGAVSVKKITPTLPAKNQYGFYFGVWYQDGDYAGWKFYSNGSVDYFTDDPQNIETYPAGYAKYTTRQITFGDYTFDVAADGLSFESRAYCGSIQSTLPQLEGDLVLPEDSGITSVATLAFSKQKLLNSILLPEGVTKIGERAFAYCDNLTNIGVPDSLRTFGYEMVYLCDKLTNFVIPSGVTTIADSAFANSGLTSIVIPDSVTSIGSSAFEVCTSLTSIVIPAGIDAINNYAFYGCQHLTEIIYKGTMSQWNAIKKYGDYSSSDSASWRYRVPATHVQCIDGQVAL